MQPANKSGLAIVYRNSQPQREAQYPNGWTLLTGDGQFKVFVCRDHASRPRVVRKEAA